MNKDLSYCIVLSSEQLSYLAGSKYGIDRMKILNRLIEATVLEQTEYSKKGFAMTLQVGQAALSEVELSCKLGYDKKTISRVIDKMNQLGIVASVQSNRTSIHTQKCVSAWMLDGKRIDNPFYVRMKNRKDGNEKTANRPYNNSILPMKQQHILESNAEANCPTQTQTDNTAVSDETYSPDLSTSPTSSETPVTAYDDKNRNGYDELKAETNNHELLHSLWQRKNQLMTKGMTGNYKSFRYSKMYYVIVCSVTRSAYVAQARFACQYHISVFRQSQAPTVLYFFR